jgi:hypothetical protein
LVPNFAPSTVCKIEIIYLLRIYVLSSVLCSGVCVGVWVCGVYTKSKTSELSPLRRKLLRFAKQFPPPLRSNNETTIPRGFVVYKLSADF